MAFDFHKLLVFINNTLLLRILLVFQLMFSLNIHSIKHHLVFDMKKDKKYDSGSHFSDKKPKELLNLKRITIRDLVSNACNYLII